MSRKNKTLRAFLHRNENPTIEQAWDCAWKGAQKEFHARSMQEMEAKIEKLVEALKLSTIGLEAMIEDGRCGDTFIATALHLDNCNALLTQIQADKGGE